MCLCIRKWLEVTFSLSVKFALESALCREVTLGSLTFLLPLRILALEPVWFPLQGSLLLRCVLRLFRILHSEAWLAGLAPGVPSTSFRLLSEVCLSVHAHGLDWLTGCRRVESSGLFLFKLLRVLKSSVKYVYHLHFLVTASSRVETRQELNIKLVLFWDNV